MEIGIDFPPKTQEKEEDPEPENPRKPISLSLSSDPIPITMKRRTAQKKKPPNNDLQVFMKNLKPIPFLPLKPLDFSSHESLLKRLGLWDFAKLGFDWLGSSVRIDLVAQLVANFDRAKRCSFVGGAKISVCRTTLARALKLPEKSSFVEMGTVTEESIRFVEDFLFHWMVLRDKSDKTWIIPREISNWVRAVKEGKFANVDWAGMVWFMMEKELIRGQELRYCYYASHMICLIKGQNEKLIHFVEEEQEEGGKNSANLSNFDLHNTEIEKQNAVIEVQKAMIKEQQKREDSFKEKIAAQQKDQDLMMNLLKGYREALKRTQTAFSEFRESCRCKNLHEPLYKDVPGSSGLVLSAKEVEEKDNRSMIEAKIRDLKLCSASHSL